MNCPRDLLFEELRHLSNVAHPRIFIQLIAASVSVSLAHSQAGLAITEEDREQMLDCVQKAKRLDPANSTVRVLSCMKHETGRNRELSYT